MHVKTSLSQVQGQRGFILLLRYRDSDVGGGQTLSTVCVYAYCKSQCQGRRSVVEMNRLLASRSSILPTLVSDCRRDELGEHDISQVRALSATSRTFMGSVVVEVLVRRKAAFVCCYDQTTLHRKTRVDSLPSDTHRSPSSAIRSFCCVPPCVKDEYLVRRKTSTSIYRPEFVLRQCTAFWRAQCRTQRRIWGVEDDSDNLWPLGTRMFSSLQKNLGKMSMLTLLLYG